MSKIDFEKLISILNMTQSDNDHEALVAIRIANTFLNNNSANWNDVIRKVPKRRVYHYNDISERYDMFHFLALIQVQEFINHLSQREIDWLNTVKNYVGRKNHVPQEHWTTVRKMWHTFREATSTEE